METNKNELYKWQMCLGSKSTVSHCQKDVKALYKNYMAMNGYLLKDYLTLKKQAEKQAKKSISKISGLTQTYIEKLISKIEAQSIK